MACIDSSFSPILIFFPLLLYFLSCFIFFSLAWAMWSGKCNPEQEACDWSKGVWCIAHPSSFMLIMSCFQGSAWKVGILHQSKRSKISTPPWRSTSLDAPVFKLEKGAPASLLVRESVLVAQALLAAETFPFFLILFNIRDAFCITALVLLSSSFEHQKCILHQST